MALRIGSDPVEWESIFIETGISVTSTKLYARLFAREKLTEDSFAHAGPFNAQ